MDLQITGTVVDVLEEQSGTGKNGPWRKQEFILETEGDYPKKVCVTQWGDNIEKFDVEEGERLTAHIDIRSREYQGRWYTDVKAWRIERPDEGSGGGSPGSGQGGGPGAPGGSSGLDRFEEKDEYDDDLPF